MSIYKVLENWGIRVPENIAIAEYLHENQKSNCFYIDKLPLAVSRENSEKFDQVDIFFQEVLNGKAASDEFCLIEAKYRNVMTKLWLYNKLYVELDGETVNKSIIDNAVEHRYKKFLSGISHNGKGKVIEVLQRDELAFWVQLGVRDAAFPIFYFEDYELLLMPSWSCYIAYLHDSEKMQVIKDIVMSEGLFVRELT